MGVAAVTVGLSGCAPAPYSLNSSVALHNDTDAPVTASIVWEFIESDWVQVAASVAKGGCFEHRTRVSRDSSRTVLSVRAEDGSEARASLVPGESLTLDVQRKGASLVLVPHVSASP